MTVWTTPADAVAGRYVTAPQVTTYINQNFTYLQERYQLVVGTSLPGSWDPDKDARTAIIQLPAGTWVLFGWAYYQLPTAGNRVSNQLKRLGDPDDITLVQINNQENGVQGNWSVVYPVTVLPTEDPPISFALFANDLDESGGSTWDSRLYGLRVAL